MNAMHSRFIGGIPCSGLLSTWHSHSAYCTYVH